MAVKYSSFAAVVVASAAFVLSGGWVEDVSAQSSPKVIDLKLATPKPPTASPVRAFKEWAQKVETASAGRVKITIYPAQSLVKLADVVPSTEKNICDIGDLVLNREDQRFPLSSLLCLPFLGLGDPYETGVKAWMEVEGKFPEMKKENSRFKVLYRHASNGGHIHTAKKPVRVPEDAKGLKIIASGHLATIMKSAGASPLAISVPEWYASLERGLAQGQVVHYHGLYETKIYKLLRYHTELGYGVAMNTEEFIMNWETWNNLPKDIQKIFDDLSPWLTDRVAELILEVDREALAEMEKEKHTIIKASLQEEKLWHDIALPMHKEWVDKFQGAGLPAKAVYEEILSTRKKFRK
jgi:TRAP-type transport system periplasmic protein